MQHPGEPTRSEEENAELRRRVRQLEEVIERCEADLRARFEVAGVGKAEADPRTGRFLRVNAALCQMTGYSEAELLARSFVDITHPDDQAADRLRIQRLVERGEVVHDVEKRYVSKQGRVFWVHVNANLVRDVGGEPLLTVAVIHDITARKQAEARLRESENRLRLFIEHAPAAMAMFDDRMRYLAASRRWREAYGISGDPTGRCHYDVFPEIPEPWKELHRRTLAGEALAADEDPLHEAGGKVRWIKWETWPWFDAEGRIGGIMIANEDVSARVQAQRRVRESEERLRLASQAGRIGVWEWHLATDMAYWCTEACALFGLQPGCRVDFQLWRACVFPDDRERATGAVMLAIEQARAGTGTASYHDEYRVQHRDGTVLWVETHGAIEPGDSGLVMRGVVRDVTERRLHEDALREAERRKDEFLAMLAHELRNPLAPIRNAVELMRRRGSGDPALHRVRGVIERQVNLLVRLVDDLLDVSRVTRGKIGLQKQPLDLAAVVRQAVETSRPLIDARSHELTIALPSDPISVEGDLARLAQVVSNLLHNAAKYTEPGGRILLSVDRAGTGDHAEAVLRVRDTGRGIDPSALGSVFELFYQASQTLDRSEGGLGIGLALAKRIVEMHGGRVEAHSEGPGQGSEFVIRLPCLPDPPAAASPAPSSTP